MQDTTKIINVILSLDFEASLDHKIKEDYQGVKDYRILSKSLDARKAPKGRRPQFQYQVALLQEGEWEAPETFKQLKPFNKPPIIIGAGPAGLFAALRFSDHGVPSILFERGSDITERMLYVSKFWRYGILDPNTNACFGEGGAGLYSDGKLLTRVKSPHISYVMQRLVDFGAPPETAYLNGPHLGSNRLRTIIKKLSDNLKEKGTSIHYKTKVEKLLVEDGKVTGVELQDGRKFYSDHVILAMGHSARDFYEHLIGLGVDLTSKDFAVGVRIEHPREYINKIQFGSFAGQDHLLGTARYRLSYHHEEVKRGTYSFCMCPGGHILSTGTEANGLVTNGMSNSSQHSPWSNAALVVSVKKGVDFNEKDPLAGARFQEAIEQRAFSISKKLATGRELPAQRVTDFLSGKVSSKLPTSSTPSKTVSASMQDIFPEFIDRELGKALLDFERKVPGFIHESALFIAPETRTSAPITIRRDKETFQSLSHSNLYPVGEGAGHAGGITSSAVDGVEAVLAILRKL